MYEMSPLTTLLLQRMEQEMQPAVEAPIFPTPAMAS